MRYETPQAFERALSDRLKRQAAEEGVDLDRLRKRVAFERFLVRLFHHAPYHWVLKGSYALELRLSGRARATKDIDLDRPPPPVEDMLDELQEAAEKDLGDFFIFRVGVPEPMKGAPLGSLRFSVAAQLAGKPFTGFALDVGQGNEPLRRLMHNFSDQQIGQMTQRSAELDIETLPASVSCDLGRQAGQ
jgi:hypothetical protein